VSADVQPVEYEVVHTTEYDYSQPVAVSHHLACLTPRVLPRQQVLHHELQIEPARRRSRRTRTTSATR
jgi:transglutaminase-like putative cysteine protease